MSDPLRIGYVAKKFPRFSETFIVNEILALEERGLEITTLSRRLPDEGRFHPSVARLGRPVRYLSEGRSDALGSVLAREGEVLDDCLDRLPDAIRWLRRFGLPSPLGLLAEALAAVAIARREGLAHLHAHFATDATTVALLAHRLGGIPYSFTAHAKDLYRDAVDPALFAEKVDGARFVVTVCDANLAHIRGRLAPRSRTPVLRLYNGIDLSFFAPAERNGARPRAIVAVGRLVPKKGFEVLVDAATQLAARGVDFEVEIIGDGECAPALRERIERAGLAGHVRLLGALPQPEVRDRLRTAAVGCLPCVVDDDGNRDALPTSLLESMAVGLPIVSTPVGGVAEIVADGETGWLVPPGEPEALATALAEALAEPERSRARGALGRRRAEALFDVRANTARLHDLFRRSAAGEPIEECR